MTDQTPPPSPSVVRLQALQQEFDRAHGLAFGTEGHPDRLAAVAFAALALAGEVGELANSVKKAQRAAWLGQDPDPDLRAAATELGDAFAYLLKLTALFGRRLDEAYLTTLSDNSFRFAPGPKVSGGRVFTIAGPSGAGKTTVAKSLANEHPTFIETTTENPFLPLLLEGSPSFDALSNQRWFLNKLATSIEESSPAQTLVLDQDPAAVVRVYGRLFRDEGRLSEAGYVALLDDLASVEMKLSRWRSLRTVIFLGAAPQTLRSRAALRGDERVPPLEWFEQVSAYFDDLRARVPHAHFISTEDRPIEAVVAEVRQLLG